MSYQFSRGYRLVVPHLDRVKSRVKGAWVGKELGHVLRCALPFLSEGDINGAASGGRISIDGVTVSLEHRLKFTETWEYLFHRHEPPVLDTPVELLYVDGSVVVVNKPSSIPVHPIGRYKKNTVTEILKEELFQGHCSQLHVVHRLDRPVSGVLVLARNRKVAKALSSLFRSNQVEKEYIARVKGNFPAGIVRVNQPVAMVNERPLSFAIRPIGRSAVTVFERQALLPGNESLVICRPETGRTNQIRLHLHRLGHPIVDDAKYGGHLPIQSSPPPEPHDYPHQSWCSECRQGRRDTSNVSTETLWTEAISLHSLSYHSQHLSWSWPPFRCPPPSWAH